MRTMFPRARTQVVRRARTRKHRAHKRLFLQKCVCTST